MGKLLALGQWLLRAWPVWAMCVVLFVHLMLLHSYPMSAKPINAAASLCSQLAGGLLVLHSLNSAIGVVRQGSLCSLFRQYLKEFPLFRPGVVISAEGVASVSMAGSAEASVIREPKTVQEQIAYLQEQITDLRRETERAFERQMEKIDRIAQDTSAKIEANSEDLHRLRRTFEDTTTGGVAEQVFGVLLVIYGSVAAYVT